MNPPIHVRIISPQEVLLDTEAVSISSKNSQGTFDILPQHANFITMIENTPIIIRTIVGTKEKPLTFNFPMAIIFTTENQVNIYTNIRPL